jgi:hypothetical protein
MMKCTNLLAALTLLANVSVSGTRVQAQQEVDPTNYPLTPTVAHAAKQPAPHTFKRSPVHSTQHATVKKTQKVSTGNTHHATIKTVSKK